MPDLYRVIITDEAFDDLTAILEFIADDSHQNAARVTERLIKAIESLDLFPRRYSIAAAATRLGMDTRSMPIASFKVLYRVQETPRVVYVLSVRHAA